jgi:hypothetical protein
MSIDNSPIHHTATNRFQDAERVGWEFVCPTCEYRVRFIVHAKHVPQLEILDPGDPQARHTSNHVPVRPIEDWPVTASDDAHEAWLTPELRQQMEDLLTDVDMGD